MCAGSSPVREYMANYKSIEDGHEIEAFQWTGNRDQSLPGWFVDAFELHEVTLTYGWVYPLIEINTHYAGASGKWIAHIGDWIVGPGPIIHPRSDEYFKEHYTLIE